MRIAVLILAGVTSVFLFIQALLIAGLSSEGSDEAAAGGVGLIMALLMLVSAAIVIPFPRIAMGLLIFVGLIGIPTAATTSYGDLWFWGPWGLLLALLSYFGYRGKKKQQAKEADRDRIAQEALAANQYMAHQMYMMQQQLNQPAPQPNWQIAPENAPRNE